MDFAEFKPKPAYELKELPGGRTAQYREIAEGRLIAHKLGRRTIILHENAMAWPNSLPQPMVRTSSAPMAFF
jgi:hypothetical protein